MVTSLPLSFTSELGTPLQQTLSITSYTADASSYLIRFASPPLDLLFANVEQRRGTFNETVQEATYVSSSYPSAPLSPEPTQCTLAIHACAEGTTVAAYIIGLCETAGTDGTGYRFASPRTLWAYTSDIMGIQQAPAVKADDLDD